MVATEKLHDSAAPATGLAFFLPQRPNPLPRWLTGTEILLNRMSFIFTKFSRYAPDNLAAITKA
jgi:hypothetical protein